VFLEVMALGLEPATTSRLCGRPSSPGNSLQKEVVPIVGRKPLVLAVSTTPAIVHSAT
jgi:hypothetical protein